MREHKTIQGSAFTKAEGCEFSAVVATLSVVDSDGDVLLPGAFAGADKVPIVPAHRHEHVPIGRARIVERGGEAVAEGEFNMDLESGREWCSALKFDLADGEPVGEWSFSFHIPEGGSSTETRDGEHVRVLSKLDVIEVSPVLRGAGVNTRTTCAGEGCQTNGKSCSCECSDASASAVVAEAELLAREWEARERLRKARCQAAVREATEAWKRLQERTSSSKPPAGNRVPYRVGSAGIRAHELARKAAYRLGIEAPAVVEFWPCSEGEQPDLTTKECWGICRKDGGEVLIHRDLGHTDSLETLGHELFHAWEEQTGRETSETKAEAYGRRFARAVRHGRPIPAARAVAA